MRFLETSLSRIHESRNLGCRLEENEFQVPCEQLIHRFLDLTKVEFLSFQEAEYDF